MVIIPPGHHFRDFLKKNIFLIFEIWLRQSAVVSLKGVVSRVRSMGQISGDLLPTVSLSLSSVMSKLLSIRLLIPFQNLRSLPTSLSLSLALPHSLASIPSDSGGNNGMGDRSIEGATNERTEADEPNGPNRRMDEGPRWLFSSLYLLAGKITRVNGC